MDLVSNLLFYVPMWKFIYIIIIHSGWSLAWIFMSKRVKRPCWHIHISCGAKNLSLDPSLHPLANIVYTRRQGNCARADAISTKINCVGACFTHYVTGKLSMNALPIGFFDCFACFFVICWLFSKSTSSKRSFRNTFGVSNSLDPDQAQQNMDPNYLQRLSEDNTMLLETMFSQNICFQWYHIHKIHTKSPYHRTPVQHCYPVRYLYRYSLCKSLGTKWP